MLRQSLTLLLFLSGTAISQDSPASKPSATKPRAGDLQVRFLAEQAPEGLGQTVVTYGETKSAAFALPTNYLSEPVAVSERAFTLKTLEKEIPLCSISLPETGSAFAVVLVTAKPAGYTPIVVRTDDPTFRAGDVFFINRSEKTILGKLGSTPLTVKPGESAKSRPSGLIDNTYYDIAFATREPQGDKLISSSRWPVAGNQRSYLFFYTNAAGRTSYRAVDEHLTPAAAAN